MALLQIAERMVRSASIILLLANSVIADDTPFRPEAGTFPLLDKAHTYRGELTFVDHPNRRGSLRIQGNGRFRFTGPSPFAMLPYGMVRYHGAPADLRDIPLGTVMHAHAFLPPDPKISSVPVLPIDNRLKKLGNAGVGTAPAENHVIWERWFPAPGSALCWPLRQPPGHPRRCPRRPAAQRAGHRL